MPIRLLLAGAVKFCLALAFALVGKSVVVAETITIDEAQVSLIQNTVVAAPVSGIVAQLAVREGESVASAQLLATLDDEQVRKELEAAEAACHAARLEAENDVDARYARRTLEVRQRELQQSLDANQSFLGAVSETEIEKLKLVVDQSRLAIEQAEHEQQVALAKVHEKQAAVEIAKARLRKHRIVSPVAGQAVEIDVEVGEWVEAGKPIARLISHDPVRVECFIDGRRYGPELVGRKVEFSLTSTANEGPMTLFGDVDFVSPELNPVTGQVRVWATINNSDRHARPGMQGQLVILDQEPTSPADAR